MNANIIVIGLPSVKDVVGKVAEVLEDAFSVKKVKTSTPSWDDDEGCDDDEFDYEPEPIKQRPCGTPKRKDIRFGYSLSVDEPQSKDYSCRSKFIRDHNAYDDFVTAGLRCEELGLEKKNDIPVTKCKAIRKCVGAPPPTGIDLLGETNWWDEDFRW